MSSHLFERSRRRRGERERAQPVEEQDRAEHELEPAEALQQRRAEAHGGDAQQDGEEHAVGDDAAVVAPR